MLRFMDSADMGRKRWAHVSKSERSLIMSELAKRPRGKKKTIPEPEMPRFTIRERPEPGTVSHYFDAAVYERNMTQRK
jgi:hypothetical protein